MMYKTNAKYLVCDQRDLRDLRQETETNLETKTEADPGNVCSIFYHTAELACPARDAGTAGMPRRFQLVESRVTDDIP